MAPRFPTAWVDQVYAASSIVDIVSGYLPLQKRGRRHWGLCPFHNEKTASFSVNPELNLYHCFGCKASGNVVQFVMEMEKLNYPEALLHLAKRFNLPPPPILEEDPLEAQRRSQRERMLEANREAALFYHEQLWLPENQGVLDYLHNRGLDDAIIRRFGLGASPDDWDSLLNHLINKGFTLEELQQAALVTVRDSSRYDTFRHRVMFPIINRYGQTIGFGARAMGDAQPKYLNTSDTLVFNKRYHVYGINLLKRLRNLDQLILVEGYLDVITLAQAGIGHVIATLGTSLTNEQVRLIKNYAPEIWIAYDGDEPGQMAALRALDVLDQEKVAGRVIRFPDGLDPDDFIRQRGIEGFKALKPVQAMAFRLLRLEAQHDLSQEEGKRKFAMEACKLLQILTEPVETDHYLGRIALKTGIAKEVLLQQLRRGLAGAGGAAHLPLPPLREKRQEVQHNPSELTLLACLSTGQLPDHLVTVEDFEEGPLRVLARDLLSGRRPESLMEEAQDEATRALYGDVFNRLPDAEKDQLLSAAEDCLRSIRQQKLAKRIHQLSQEASTQEGEQQLLTLQVIAELKQEQKRQAGSFAR